MNKDDLELAYDEVCNACAVATSNSSDGGKMPCRNHQLLFMKRTYPVIHTTGLWDGEWTHTEVRTDAIRNLLVSVIEAFVENGRTGAEGFVDDLGVTVIHMTKEEIAKVPEL